ncbi:hypothetical protein CAAN3_17S01178 [[Candida] anglica]
MPAVKSLIARFDNPVRDITVKNETGGGNTDRELVFLPQPHIEAPTSPADVELLKCTEDISKILKELKNYTQVHKVNPDSPTITHTFTQVSPRRNNGPINRKDLVTSSQRSKSSRVIDVTEETPIQEITTNSNKDLPQLPRTPPGRSTWKAITTRETTIYSSTNRTNSGSADSLFYTPIAEDNSPDISQYSTVLDEYFDVLGPEGTQAVPPPPSNEKLRRLLKKRRHDVQDSVLRSNRNTLSTDIANAQYGTPGQPPNHGNANLWKTDEDLISINSLRSHSNNDLGFQSVPSLVSFETKSDESAISISTPEGQTNNIQYKPEIPQISIKGIDERRYVTKIEDTLSRSTTLSKGRKRYSTGRVWNKMKRIFAARKSNIEKLRNGLSSLPTGTNNNKNIPQQSTDDKSTEKVSEVAKEKRTAEIGIQTDPMSLETAFEMARLSIKIANDRQTMNEKMISSNSKPLPPLPPLPPPHATRRSFLKNEWINRHGSLSTFVNLIDNAFHL